MPGERTPCPEFPFFGANYPDATCIDGYLCDLDSGSGGQVVLRDDYPCPFCNFDSWLESQEGNGALNALNAFRAHYGFAPVAAPEGAKP